ncbi:acyl-CoA dehydrogenase family protein [Nocardia sp. XZ_19_231]|uniref:acyl-CoA dehydrogenase family protein n=1 Tax=Nocardia sp. XZ_19_231 TaxID=2769252 RepID=UPI00189052BB|nr:acyl-CoA dehydrogenase family protein [Nocardia sp. XZ_19_231]
MRFALSTEQLDFAAELRKILEAGKAPAAVRAWAAGDAAKGRALLRQIAEMGVFGLIVDEKYDGADATPVDLVVALIELGRGAVPGPVIESTAVIPALLQRLPDDAPAQRWLSALASGDALGTVTFEPQRGIALDADIAEPVLLATDGRLTLGLPSDGDATTEPVTSIDPARKLFRVTADELIAEGPEVEATIDYAFDIGVLACAAQLLGAGRSILEQTTSYAKQRKQFGRAIGEFQAVKQQLADVLIALDLAEPLLYRAALTLDSSDRARDVSAALVTCGDAAHRAARAGLQVHGAIGYTAEFDLSLWLTKVAALRTAWGTADFHRARIAAALRDAEPAAAAV